MKRILVTGFEPFGGEQINPASEVLKHLKGPANARLFTAEIPTVFGQAIESLRQLIETHQPDLVICVGQAGGRPDLTIERVAINVDDARIPDNAGQQPIDQPIVPSGPVAYWSSLPIKRIVQALRRAGIPASVSQTAGTFVCNHLFYGLCHLLEQRGDGRGGFIHIPYLPSQAVAHPGQPSLPLDFIVQGLEIALDTALTYEEDLTIGGGQTH